MKFSFIGPSYTAASTAVADQECINWLPETAEAPAAQTKLSFFRTPGLKSFALLPQAPCRGSILAGGRLFAVGGAKLYEVAADGTPTERGDVATSEAPASLAVSNIQILIVSGGHAYCYTLATDVMVEVTSSLAGTPVKVEFSDTYFIVSFSDSNKFEMSDLLDGTTWPGLYVNAISVFPENIRSIIVSHRELWVCGERHMQPYQNTGSDNIFDVIPGALIEKGCASTFGIARLDNTVFWVDEDERGGRSAWRASGYTPQRISTHAVETALASYDSVAGLVTYAYQDGGHLFWVLYIPNTDCSWVYDVAEGMWHKRATWDAETSTFSPHHSWNHVYAFGKHLVGDWATGNLYEMSMTYLDDDGANIRRVRRSPTITDEAQWIRHADLTVDFATGDAPQPALTDGEGNPRPPQAMLRWSDNRGRVWSNEHIQGGSWSNDNAVGAGMAGEYNTRVIWRRLGRSRYRVYELSVTDPVDWCVVDSYLRLS